MRRTHPLVLVVLVAAAIPNVVFSLGCIAPGCGGSHDVGPAPADLAIDAVAPEVVADVTTPPGETGTFAAPTGDTGRLGETGETEDTGALPAPEPCGGEPALTLADPNGDGASPPPDEVFLSYGTVESCSVDRALGIGVVADGLLPGPVDVAWTVTVEGDSPRSGGAVWTMGCLSGGGMAPGALALELPVSADGKRVTIAIEAVDAEGTAVSASHVVLAHVSEGAAED